MATSDRLMPVDEAKARLAATPLCSSQEMDSKDNFDRYGPELDTSVSDTTGWSARALPEWLAHWLPLWLWPSAQPDG
jgi:hypothetical protein